MSHQQSKNHSLNSMDEDDEDLMFKIVHGSCQGFNGCNSCSIEQQLDLFAHCRQPMSFLSLFGHSEPTVLPPGAFTMPDYCEYCGKKPCAKDCRRPTFFFQKKRPPFDNNDDKWDENDHPKPANRPASPSSLLFSGLFGRSHHSGR